MPCENRGYRLAAEGVFLRFWTFSLNDTSPNGARFFSVGQWLEKRWRVWYIGGLVEAWRRIVPQSAASAQMAERDELTTDAIESKSRTIHQLVFSQSFLAFE